MKHLRIAAILTILFTLTLAGALMASTCEEAIVDKMREMYDLDTSSYTIEILSNPLKSSALTSKEITLRPLTSKEPLGLFTVMARVSQDDGVVESGQVRMKIRRYADVVVLSGNIRSRQPLSEDKLVVKRMDVTSMREKPLRSLKQVSGYRARRNLRPGTILTAAAMEPVPDVEPGREVSIVYMDGLCRITAAGVALQSGLAGDYIKVKNKGSGKIIRARVVDVTAVAVDP